MSYEHVWGQWILPYVRADMKKHHFYAERINRPGEPNTASATLRAGDPMRSKARVVCKTCNNGWMSLIQERAKPIMIPLIEGKPTALSHHAQTIVATWCAMATMTSEFLDKDLVPSTIAVSQDDREFLWKEGVPPPERWRIWITRYQRHKWVGRWFHSVVPILDAKDVPSSALTDYPSPNTQKTTFTVGDLYVHVMSTSGNPDIVSRWVWPIRSRPGMLLIGIWPIKESIITWPPESLTDSDADFVATAHDLAVDAASRSVLGRRMF
jgi:hypothetical protein